jgi:LacI family transcriptional regulator
MFLAFSAKSLEGNAKAMTKPPRIPHVLLLVETSLAYGRGVVEGIGRYALEHGPWSIQFEARALDSLPPRWLKNWRGDGIISRTISLKAAKMLKATRLPLVEMLGDPKFGVAQVRADLGIASRMAAEHFIDSGLRQFAYFAYEETFFTTEHFVSFQGFLESRGFSCHFFKAPPVKKVVAHWDERLRPSVVKWLRSLPHPIGIYTTGDAHAVRLLDICREMNIAVPEEVAILGNGNDPVICETLRPTLSSLDLDAKRIGYEAARLLARKMNGEKVEETILIPASHVAVRQSTDLMVVEDPDVAQAMRFIREYACSGIDVAMVADTIGVSLSLLERRFQKYLGRTPKSEIVRIQIEHAKRMLNQTDRNCAAIARKCGFHSQAYFTIAFRREVGMTPNAYRRMDRAAK